MKIPLLKGEDKHALSVFVERELDRDMNLTTHWLERPVKMTKQLVMD